MDVRVECAIGRSIRKTRITWRVFVLLLFAETWQIYATASRCLRFDLHCLLSPHCRHIARFQSSGHPISLNNIINTHCAATILDDLVNIIGIRHTRELVDIVLGNNTHLNVHYNQLLYKELQTVRNTHDTKRPTELRHMDDTGTSRACAVRASRVRQTPRKLNRPIYHRAHKKVLIRVIYRNHARLVTNGHMIFITAHH